MRSKRVELKSESQKEVADGIGAQPLRQHRRWSDFPCHGDFDRYLDYKH